MMAITVKTMKLVMKIPWNSFASASVSPDIEGPVGFIAMQSFSRNGLAAVVAPVPRDWDHRDETCHGFCSARGRRGGTSGRPSRPTAAWGVAKAARSCRLSFGQDMGHAFQDHPVL